MARVLSPSLLLTAAATVLAWSNPGAVWADGPKELAVLKQPDVVMSVAVSPDGKTAAVGTRSKVLKLWDLSGKELRSLEGHELTIDALAFSPDGKTLASGGFDKTIRLWELATGKLLHALKGHEGDIASLPLNP